MQNVVQIDTLYDVAWFDVRQHLDLLNSCPPPPLTIQHVNISYIHTLTTLLGQLVYMY